NKKTRATTAAGGRFLAPCLTWRQYAANHHESSIVLTNNSRGPRDVKSWAQPPTLRGRNRDQGAHEPADRRERPLELRRLRGVAQPQVPFPTRPEGGSREHGGVVLGEQPLGERLAREAPPGALQHSADVGETVEGAGRRCAADSLDRVQAAGQQIALRAQSRHHASDRILRPRECRDSRVLHEGRGAGNVV